MHTIRRNTAKGMAAKLPKVSIIIPYREDRGWLNEAISSVKGQVYNGEIELILSKSDGNVAFNLNEGIKQATGQYIKYLCDDDQLTPMSVGSSVVAMEGNDFINGKAENFWPHGKIQVYAPPIRIPTLQQMAAHNTIHGGTLMYRADVFDRIGLFDESLTCAEEYEFNMRCLSKGMKLGYSDQILYRYRRHDHQKSLGKAVDQNSRALKIKQIQQRYANT